MSKEYIEHRIEYRIEGEDVVGRGVSGPGVAGQAIAGARRRRRKGIVDPGLNSTRTSSRPGAHLRGRRPLGPIDGHVPSPCPSPLPVLIPLHCCRRPAPTAGRRPASGRGNGQTSGAHARAGDAGRTCASPCLTAAAWGVRIQHRRPARGRGGRGEGDMGEYVSAPA